MLKLPVGDVPFKVMGVDPGTTTMGVSFLTWDMVSRYFIVEDAFTITAKPNDPHYESISEIHGNRMARIKAHEETILRLLTDNRPAAVISESPFMGRFPQSYMALVECVLCIRNGVLAYDRHMPLYSVDPTTAKQSAGMKVTRKSDKEDVRIALRSRTDLRWGVDLESLDEHSVDAVAVGLHYLLNMI